MEESRNKLMTLSFVNLEMFDSAASSRYASARWRWHDRVICTANQTTHLYSTDSAGWRTKSKTYNIRYI